ncbi:hypothetical protein SDC9_106765 [bioreactor metagenome]|uniref:Uncharacterized protein n=1 Tax=bioreactor metagenome TaxID=1076179 RepID=A0A645B3C1_9ZZZZ
MALHLNHPGGPPHGHNRQRLVHIVMVSNHRGQVLGQRLALHLVDQVVVHQLQRVLQQLRGDGRSVERHFHAPAFGRAYRVIHIADLVLQQQNIPCLKPGQHLVDIRGRHFSVCTRANNDAVLPCRCALNDRVPADRHQLAQRVDIHTRLFQCVNQQIAVGPHGPGMCHPGTRPCQRDRLVEPLAAATGLERGTGDRLPRRHKMFNAVNLVDVQRTQVQYPHSSVSSSFSWGCRAAAYNQLSADQNFTGRPGISAADTLE